MNAPERDIDALWRERPRSRFVRATLVLVPLLVGATWASSVFDWSDLFAARRAQNLRRFLADELAPYPLRESGFSWGALWEWTGGLWRERGADGLLATACMAVLAITLAALAATLFAPLAARNVMSPTPFEFARAGRTRSTRRDVEPAESARRSVAGRLAGASDPRGARHDARMAAVLWRAATAIVRAALILLRAIPEYVWAFLLLAMLGPSAWPAVLALAIHNSGILGKLGAETIENLESRPLVAWHTLGASRAQVWAGAVIPLALGRFLLYFFYRFETCVREATVLGMLGVASLGYWIQDARAKHFYDEMLFFVVLGAAIVLAGDLVSALARRAVRRAR